MNITVPCCNNPSCDGCYCLPWEADTLPYRDPVHTPSTDCDGPDADKPRRLLDNDNNRSVRI